MPENEPKPGDVMEVIIDQMVFPRGGGVVGGEVLFYLVPEDHERDGAEILVRTSMQWNRELDVLDHVRRSLVRNAHRLLNAAARLSEEELLSMLDTALDEADPLDPLKGRRQH